MNGRNPGLPGENAKEKRRRNDEETKRPGATSRNEQKRMIKLTAMECLNPNGTLVDFCVSLLSASCDTSDAGVFRNIDGEPGSEAAIACEESEYGEAGCEPLGQSALNGPSRENLRSTSTS